MINPEIETLFIEADQAASGNNWEDASAYLNRILEQHPDHPEALTGLGISKLHLEEFNSAVNHFLVVADLNPQSPDAYNNLGVAYALQNKYDKAERAYKRAILLDTDNSQAWKNLADIYLLQEERILDGVQILAAVIQNNPEDIEALGMMAACYQEARDLDSAIFLYQEILKLDPENQLARGQIQSLESERPRQPQIARPEHIQKLAVLEDILGKNGKTRAAKLSAGFFGPHNFAFTRRLSVPARTLADDKHQIKVSSVFSSGDLDQFQHFIFSRPHASDDLYQGFQACLDAGKSVTVDLDLDFGSLPPSHPEYNLSGPGNSEAMERLDKVLDSGCPISVPSAALASTYQEQGFPAVHIPTGWLSEAEIGDQSPPARNTVNFGMISTHVHPEFSAVVRDQITSAVNQTPRALLVAAGDYQLLAQFPEVDENKTMFIPLGAYQDYSFTLAHFDVLLVPEPEGGFCQGVSDLPLIEAGVQKIPWLASPAPAFADWSAGGFQIQENQWSDKIAELVANPSLRKELGQAGFEKAQERESRQILKYWEEIIKEGS